MPVTSGSKFKNSADDMKMIMSFFSSSIYCSTMEMFDVSELSLYVRLASELGIIYTEVSLRLVPIPL